MIAFVPYCMARTERLWGHDAAQFRPERWLKEGVFQHESPYKFSSFHVSQPWIADLMSNSVVLHMQNRKLALAPMISSLYTCSWNALHMSPVTLTDSYLLAPAVT